MKQKNGIVLAFWFFLGTCLVVSKKTTSQNKLDLGRDHLNFSRPTGLQTISLHSLPASAPGCIDCCNKGDDIVTCLDVEKCAHGGNDQGKYALVLANFGTPSERMLKSIKSMRAAADLANFADIVLIMTSTDAAKMTPELSKLLAEWDVKIHEVPWSVPPDAKFYPKSNWCGHQDMIRIHVMGLEGYDAVAYYDSDCEFQGDILPVLMCAAKGKFLSTNGGIGEALNLGFFAVKPDKRLVEAARHFARENTYSEQTGWGNSGWKPNGGYFVGGECGQGFFYTLFYKKGQASINALKSAGAWENGLFEPAQIDRCIWNYQTSYQCRADFDCERVRVHHKPTGERGTDKNECEKLEFREMRKELTRTKMLQRSAKETEPVTSSRTHTQDLRGESEKGEGEPAPCRIFTLWEYKDGPPLYVRLNVEGWRRHSRGRCGEPILIDDANVKQYIPDMPDEYFRMPYSAAKSDLIRYAVIYHHGGIYMDTDFLVVQDLDTIIEKVPTHDLVSYEGAPDNMPLDDAGTAFALASSGCSKSFSSNFMAGRKGSVFMKSVWERQKQIMVSHCPLADKESNKPCCFKEPGEQCHIPWGAIGEGVSHVAFSEVESGGSGMKSYCFSNDASFVLPRMIAVMEKVKGAKGADRATDFWRNMKKVGCKGPWDRIMYHTFNSVFSWATLGCKELFDNNTIFGRLNVLSYSTGHGKTPLKETSASREFHRKSKIPDERPCPDEVV